MSKINALLSDPACTASTVHTTVPTKCTCMYVQVNTSTYMYLLITLQYVLYFPAGAVSKCERRASC